jgi:hypothetical protein
MSWETEDEIMGHLIRRAVELEREAEMIEIIAQSGEVMALAHRCRQRAHALRVQAAARGIMPTPSQIKREAERDTHGDYDFALGKDGRFAE